MTGYAPLGQSNWVSYLFVLLLVCIVDLVIVFIVPCRLVRGYVFYLILECHLISVRNGLSLGHQGVGVGMAWGRVTRQSGKQGTGSPLGRAESTPSVNYP